ncbi:MAG: hypothetical protein IJW70_06845 [Clostridia bacterium]|nr:hypothetical protein [Clostridia bacterium]
MTQNESEIQICCAQYNAAGIMIRARLLAQPEGIGAQYVIALEQEGELTVCHIGSSMQAAREIFLRVVFGGVTACTLTDVVEDYMGTIF